MKTGGAEQLNAAPEETSKNVERTVNKREDAIFSQIYRGVYKRGGYINEEFGELLESCSWKDYAERIHAM